MSLGNEAAVPELLINMRLPLVSTRDHRELTYFRV